MILESDSQYSNMGPLHAKYMFLGNLLNFSVDQFLTLNNTNITIILTS